MIIVVVIDVKRAVSQVTSSVHAYINQIQMRNFKTDTCIGGGMVQKKGHYLPSLGVVS